MGCLHTHSSRQKGRSGNLQIGDGKETCHLPFVWWATADAELGVPCVENPELSVVLPSKSGSIVSEYRHECFAHCHQFLSFKYVPFPVHTASFALLSFAIGHVGMSNAGSRVGAE